MPAGGTTLPHRIQPVQDPKVAKRNHRERARIKMVRATYAKLEALIPTSHWPSHKKGLPRRDPAPQLAVIKAATAYINYLAAEHNKTLDTADPTTSA
jgi:hypothetical protein